MFIIFEIMIFVVVLCDENIRQGVHSLYPPNLIFEKLCQCFLNFVVVLCEENIRRYLPWPFAEIFSFILGSIPNGADPENRKITPA